MMMRCAGEGSTFGSLWKTKREGRRKGISSPAVCRRTNLPTSPFTRWRSPFPQRLPCQMMRHRPQCPGAGCSSSVCSKASNALYITPGPQLKGPAERFRNLAAGMRRSKYQPRLQKLVFVYHYGLAALGIKSICERPRGTLVNTCKPKPGQYCLEPTHIALPVPQQV